MTLTDSRTIRQPASQEAPDGQEAPDRAVTGRRRGVLALLGVIVAVAALAQLPLVRNRIFYFWDDSAAAFLPNWYYIGEQLRGGNWPLLNPDMWMGGNFAAESMMGLFNPLLLGNYVVVSLLPDLALAATLVKTEFLVVLAAGVYLLAREYGAGRRSAAVVAIALPFSGYTLYFDASAWAAGLICFAFLPYVWWSARRFARGELNPIVPVMIGLLAMTVGNPYGALGTAVVLGAVGIEQLVQRKVRRFWTVVLIGLIIGAGSAVVYLPLLGSSAVSWRQGAGVVNNGFLVPNLGDLLALSAPTYQPQYPIFDGSVLSFPSLYLAWFIAPLVPWLRWSVLAERARERVGLAVFAAVYLLFLFGPSNLWLFRWPSRLTEYAYLPILIAVALVLDGGLVTANARRRAVASAAIVLAGGYLSWASTPQGTGWHLAATALVLALAAAAVYAYRRWQRRFHLVLALGTALVLALQTQVFTGNFNVTPWHFPHDVSQLRSDFDGRYQGNTLQVVNLDDGSRPAPPTPDGLWRDVLPANIAHTAGIQALNSYTGIGHVAFSRATCMNHYGGTCREAFAALWQQADGTEATYAELFRLQTVVVDPDFTVDAGTGRPIGVPDGWAVAKRGELVTVYRRATPPPWPDGTASWAHDDVWITADKETDARGGERLSYQGSGRIVFAKLAWPGYQATVDGRAIGVQQGPAGLLMLDLPASAPGGSTVQLSFTPPGHRIGIPLLLASLIVALGYGLGWQVARWLGRRRLED